MSDDKNTLSNGAYELHIPEDWDVISLREVIREYLGGANLSRDDFTDEGVEVIPKKAVNDDLYAGIPESSRQFCSYEYFEKNKTSQVEYGDIITTSRDLNEDAPNIGRMAILDTSSQYPCGNDLIIAQGVNSIETNSNINDWFISNMSHGDYFRKVAKAIAVGSTQVHIRKPEFLSVNIPYPGLPEQRRIASVLYSVDQQIRTLTDRHDSLTQLKHGLMQDLLTGETRVTPEIDGDYDSPEYIEDYEIKEENRGPFTFEVPEEWSIEPLNDVSKLITRGKQPDYDESSELPVLNQKCIYWDGFRFENERYTPSDDWKKPKYHVNEGDLLVNSTGKGTVGRCLVYNKNEDRVIDGHITRVVMGDKVKPEFIRYFFESKLGSALLHSMGVNGSTGQVELSKEQFGFIPVPVPPLWEQERIASVLYTVAEMIARTSDLIDEYERLKRGLMQDLLSGNVRTPEDLSVLDEIKLDADSTGADGSSVTQSTLDV